MADIFKYFSTGAAIVLVAFVQLFLSPYRSELEILGIKEKDASAIIVAITFFAIAILLIFFNIFLDKIKKIKVGDFLLAVDLLIVIFCLSRIVYWINIS